MLYKKKIVLWGRDSAALQAVGLEAVNWIRNYDVDSLGYGTVAFGLPSEAIENPQTDPDYDESVECLLQTFAVIHRGTGEEVKGDFPSESAAYKWLAGNLSQMQPAGWEDYAVEPQEVDESVEPEEPTVLDDLEHVLSILAEFKAKLSDDDLRAFTEINARTADRRDGDGV